MDFFISQISSNISPTTAISTLVVVSLAVLYYVLRDKDLPPGPRGLPYFGYYPFLNDEALHLQLQKFKEKYGEVYSFKIVGQLYIHLGTIKALKEAHVTKSDCFAKRYSDFNIINFIFKEGILCSNGESWKVQRKFYIQAFRQFGLTSMKDYLAGPIHDSLMTTVESLKSTDGKAVNVINILNLQCSVILRRMMFNDEEITTDEIKELIECFGKLFSIFFNENILLQGEFARRVIFNSANYKSGVESRKIMVDILRRIIQRHETTFNKDNIRDLIDSYIKERNERRSKNDPSAEYFTENDLISSLMQFVGDGIATVAIAIANLIFELLEHPEEQEKIFKELEEVVGPDRLPTMGDKSKLPYANAFIYEVLRVTDIFPIFTSLECTKETTLNGYKIPKGAVTVTNFWSCHRDPNTFEDPHQFKPSRYITEAGKEKAELPIIFGIGKRSCIGESFVTMQIFLFLTTIVKNFRLVRSEGLDRKSLVQGNMEIYAHPRK